MAAYLQWRRFVFFDKEPVRLPGEGGNPLTLPPGLTLQKSGRRAASDMPVSGIQSLVQM